MYIKLLLVLFFIINSFGFSYERIISTAPSNTEILVDLGLGDKIIAADTNSKEIIGVPKNVATLDFKNIDLEKILALNPEVVIASTHNFSSAGDPLAMLREAGIQIYYISTAQKLSDINTSIEEIGKITGKEKEALELSKKFTSEINKIKEQRSNSKSKKEIYFEINPEPYIFTFGKNTFLDEMITLVGGHNIFSDEKGWISPSIEKILEYDPKIIFTNLPKPNATENILKRKDWQEIDAVTHKKVFQIDESSLRCSHRLIKALKEMNEYIDS